MRDSAAKRAVATDVLWFSGAVALGVGVTLLLLDQSSDDSSTAVQAGCFDAACGLRAVDSEGAQSWPQLGTTSGVDRVRRR